VSRSRARRGGGGACVVDEKGLAVRALPTYAAAANWAKKHFPGLGEAERRKRIWSFASRTAAHRFFARQIELGCRDEDVLAMLTYFAGVSTERGLDVPAGRIDREARARTEAECRKRAAQAKTP